MWLRVTDLCQGCFGVVDVPTHIQAALYAATALPTLSPSSPPLNFSTYLDILESKNYSGQFYHRGESLERIRHFASAYSPAYENIFTVDDLEMHNECASPQKSSKPQIRFTRPVHAEWHCKGRNLAYNFFQFVFHEKQAYLSDPATLWACALANFHLAEAPLATYIQLLGIKAELSFPNPPPHVVKNIFERRGLSIRELDARREAFPKAIAYMIERAERMLV